MEKLGVGVIGVGAMGQRHAENLRHLTPGAWLVAVADADPQRVKRVADGLEIEHYYERAEPLLNRKDVQAVVISSPGRFHASAIRMAAEAGKDILCEKPLGLTMEEVDAALEAVAKAGVRLQVGHMRRYDPGYTAAKARIEAGEIGEPVIFKSLGRDAEGPPAENYRPRTEGTLFLDSTVHEFDLARWLMSDEVVEVQAFCGTLACPEFAALGGFDSGVVNLRFARGAIGNTESFINARYGYDIRTEIVGTQGTLVVGQLRETPLEVLTASGQRHDALRHWLVRFADAYRLEMQDWVQMLLSEGPPRVTGHDGRQAVAIALAAERSWKESRPVRL